MFIINIFVLSQGALTVIHSTYQPPLFKLISIFSLSILFFTAFAANAASFTPPSAKAPDLETRYIVKFKEPMQSGSRTATATAAISLTRDSLLSANGAEVRTRLPRMNAVSVKVGDKGLAKLRGNADVEYVELDQPRRFLSQSSTWGIGEVEATLISDENAGAITVCIIDSGYDIASPDLMDNNHSGSNDFGTGNWFEPGGSHGTHVAGTIAAVNNSEGVIGILPNRQINIHIVKVFNESGWGYSSSLVAAVQTCADNGANVVNMSLGGGLPSNTERTGMSRVADAGVLLIAAAGNDGNSALSYPASYDSVVSVAAIDSNRDQAEFSQFNSRVELSAPGVAILSTVGVGDGVQSSITRTDGTEAVPNAVVVPQDHYIVNGESYLYSVLTGEASGELSECLLSDGGIYNCGDMTNKLCLIERRNNQAPGVYPEVDPVLACVNAGAEGVIVYSNLDRPGLQSPFLVDENAAVNIPTVSVDRATAATLQSMLGTSLTLNTRSGTDYAFYNGTSMATPHVVGVAALVWSQFPECGAQNIRDALAATAIDLGTTGRDDIFGFGLVQSAAAVSYLSAEGCETPPAPPVVIELANKQALVNLSAEAGEVLNFSLRVPNGQEDLTFITADGTGNADIFVQRGRLPTAEDNACASAQQGSSELCIITNPPGGRWFVSVVAAESFNGVTLVGGFNPPTTSSNTFTNNRNVRIPDNDPRGRASVIESSYDGVSGLVKVEVRIKHTFIGDLQVDVIHPDGTSVTVHQNEGGDADNLIATYFVDFGNRSALGPWRLLVSDLAGADTGMIDSWTITFE